MKFRKLAAFTAALTICAAVFTACGSDTGESNASDTQSQSVTDNTLSEAESNSQEAESEESLREEEESRREEEQTGSGVLSEAADAALANAEWPAMAEMDDPDFIADFFLLDAGNANYKDLLVLKCPMSANLAELIIIEADDVSSAQADLENRQKKAQEQDAFYPDDVEKAGTSIVGTEGSYAYFIMGSNPDSVETALVNYLKSI